MKTFLANMQHAARNNETVTMGGGTFTPEEVGKVLATVTKMVAFVGRLATSDDDEFGPWPEACKIMEEVN